MNNINISIDDISPHPLSSIKVLDRCFELIDIYPDIKFTLFVPLAYWRTVRPAIATKKPLILSEFPDFCDSLNKLPKKNFEIGYHGYYHGIPYKNDNDEFKDICYEEAIKKFNLMFSIVKETGLQDLFSPIFRPPAWRMSEGAIQAAKDCGIKTLALFSADKRLQKKFKINYPALNKEININHASSIPPFIDLKLKAETDIVYHACEWDKNYLSKQLTQDLVVFLKQQKNKISFKFNYNE